MWLQPIGLPDTLHRRGRMADLLAHSSQALLGRAPRLALDRANNGSDLVVADLAPGLHPITVLLN